MDENKQINRLYLQYGKPYVTSNNIAYEVGKEDVSPNVLLEDNYIISKDDLKQILPRISKDVAVCYGVVGHKELFYFASDSEINQYKTELENDIKDIRVFVHAKELEYEQKIKKMDEQHEQEMLNLNDYIRYLQAKIDEHDARCCFAASKIKYDSYMWWKRKRKDYYYE